jgi:adenylate cyclase
MRALRRALTQASARPIAALQGRNVGEALKHASLALEVMQKGTTKHLLTAITNLRHARELDRYCALAYAGMGEALVRKYLCWDGDSTFLDEARDYCGRALTLDSGCARAHTSLGFANHVSEHSADAQREYRLAIQVDNGEWFAHRLLGALLAREGNFKNASPLLMRAIGLRPEHIASYDHLYNVLQRLDRYEEALEVAEKGIAAAHKHLGKVPDDQNARLHMATLQARMGLQDDARAQIAAARARAPKDGYTAFHCATAHALMGEVDEALDALARAQARGYYVKSELLRNPDFDVLRGMPAFEDLAQ